MFPPIPLEWATDDNYDAGADPWSGTPTKVDPTAQAKTKGFIPETPGSAMQLNYLLNKFASIANAMTNALLGRWMGPQTFPATMATAASGNYWAVPFFSKRHRAWFQGSAIGGSNDLYRTRNYVDWKAVTTGIGGGDQYVHGAVNNNPASANYGDMICVSRNTNICRRYSYASNTWSTFAFPAPAIRATETICHDAFNATFIAISLVAGSGLICETTPDTSYAWTTRTLAGSPTGTSGAGRNGRLHISPTGIALFLGTDTTINVSSNGGSSWVEITPPATPQSEHAFTWVPGSQEWIMAATNGSIYSSPDAITWTLKAATTIFGTGYVGGYIHSLAALGSAVWCTWCTPSTHGGLGVSTDGGLTWVFSGPGSTTETVGTSGARGMVVAGVDAIMATKINGAAGTVGNGYTFLPGVDRVPLATL